MIKHRLKFNINDCRDRDDVERAALYGVELYFGSLGDVMVEAQVSGSAALEETPDGFVPIVKYDATIVAEQFSDAAVTHAARIEQRQRAACAQAIIESLDEKAGK